MRSCVLVGLLFASSPAFANPDPKPEPCFGIESCLARCTAGHGVACTRAATLVGNLSDDKRATTVKSLETTLTKQCIAAKDGSACYEANALACDELNAGIGGKTCPTATGFRKGCELGDGASCMALGRLASVGTGGEKKNAARAKQLWEQGRALLDGACHDGSAPACTQLGATYNIDRYGTEDKALSRDAYRRAIPLFARDCRAGDAAACFSIHLLFLHDRDVKADPARSRAGLERMCKLEPKHEDCGKPTGGATTIPMKQPTKVPTVSIGEPATGNADRPIIKRSIQREIGKVRYCYEKTLVGNPGLAGSVTVKFTIEPDGTVSSATGSGLHPDVDSCVANVVQGMTFPKPSGGGRVNVSYPFAFRPAS